MAAVAEGRKRRRRSAPSPGAAQGGALGDSSLHELSLQLEAEAEALSTNLPAGVTGCRVLKPGLVELRLAPAAVKEAAGAHHAHAQDGLVQDELGQQGLGPGLGFGSREWPLIVGGEGVGDDPTLAAALGTPPRGPVAVRFGTAVGLDAVDDCGMVDSTFWADHDLERPTLRGIANKALRWLARAPENERGDDASASASSESKTIETSTETKRWHKAAAAAEAKVTTVTTYRKLAVEPRLVSTHGDMAKEWLVPAVADLLCVPDGPGGGGGGGGMGGGGGEAMTPKDSAALLQAAAPEHLGEGIYRFALFTPAFCKAMCDEIDSYEASGLPARRPNTMNNGGLVVNDIGTLTHFGVWTQPLTPLAHHLPPALHRSPMHQHANAPTRQCTNTPTHQRSTAESVCVQVWSH